MVSLSFSLSPFFFSFAFSSTDDVLLNSIRLAFVLTILLSTSFIYLPITLMRIYLLVSNIRCMQQTHYTLMPNHQSLFYVWYEGANAVRVFFSLYHNLPFSYRL
ncbi:hypothetical protein BJ165DRAFT_1426465 [Panaeolus papilionaceus]|nr:hypothetical protein BJ165DRAFT_1426465 [Panaeolus papilionaceus]